MTRFELDLLYALDDYGYVLEDDIYDINIIRLMRDRGYFENINDDMTLGQAIRVYKKLLEKENKCVCYIENMFKKSISYYGKEGQSRLAMEECAGLIQSINKMIRYPDRKTSKPNLIEEIANVEIRIFQLKQMYNIEDDMVNNYKLIKAHSEKSRIEELKEENKNDNV